MIVNAIYAHDLNGKMGTSDGRLPWRVPPFCDNPEIAAFAKADMENFKKTTIGNIVIMGYNTYLTFKSPLPNRWNFVIDRSAPQISAMKIASQVKIADANEDYRFAVSEDSLREVRQNDWHFFPSIEKCLEVLGELEKSTLARGEVFPKVFVIGGAKLLSECRAKNLLNGEVFETVFPWVM